MTDFKSKTVHSWSSANQLLNEVEQDMTNYQLKPDVINRSRMLRLITQTEGLIFLHILRKPNSINVSLFKDQWKTHSNLWSVAPWDPCFFPFFLLGCGGGGGSKGSTFPTNRKNFSDKPKNFPDYNILNLHRPVDNFDNFWQPWQFSDNFRQHWQFSDGSQQ